MVLVHIWADDISFPLHHFMSGEFNQAVRLTLFSYKTVLLLNVYGVLKIKFAVSAVPAALRNVL